MKLKKIIIAVYILSIIICFWGTRWYYTEKNNKEVIKMRTTNIEFCHLLSSELANKNRLRAFINKFNDYQMKLLAKDLGVPNKHDIIMQKLGIEEVIQPRKLKLGEKFP